MDRFPHPERKTDLLYIKFYLFYFFKPTSKARFSGRINIYEKTILLHCSCNSPNGLQIKI